MSRDMTAAESLEQWLCREMPAGTVIGDPKWWAPKIEAVIRSQASPAQMDQYDSGSRVLREVFSLCEDTQDKCATPDANDFNRGRAFEAKGIARAIGAWYQAEFCGQSFMGEPVTAPPADEWVKELEAELARVREERDALRAAWECAKRQNAHDMLLSGDEIHQHDAAIQQARGAK